MIFRPFRLINRFRIWRPFLIVTIITTPIRKRPIFCGIPSSLTCIDNRHTYSQSQWTKLRSRTTQEHRRNKSIRISIGQRIAIAIYINIDPTAQPDRITLNVAPQAWSIVPLLVVMRPRLFIKILPREPQVHPRTVAAALQRVPKALAQGLQKWNYRCIAAL